MSNQQIFRAAVVSVSAVTPVAIAQPCMPEWSSVGEGVTSGGLVEALAVFDDGAGRAVYAGGSFSDIGRISASRIAKWDGEAWSALGDGLDDRAADLAVFESALYAGGRFSFAGGDAAAHVARWDGSGWASLGNGVDSSVNALAVFDDGSGPALYVGGGFTEAGGVPANSIARWDGDSWTALGDGLDAPVTSLASFDDGSGPALYVGGEFNKAGTVTANGIARWDGDSWAALGVGLEGSVHALAVFDDGSGAELYAGTDIFLGTGVGIAKWNGASWVAIGGSVGGVPSGGVYALEVFDSDAGPALYAAGRFSEAGGVSAAHIASWDGQQWLPLAAGMDSAVVWSLLATPDGLLVVGSFSGAGGQPGTSGIARWSCQTASTCYPDCDDSGDLDFFDFICFQNEFAAGESHADCDESGDLDFFDFICFQNHFAAGCL